MTEVNNLTYIPPHSFKITTASWRLNNVAYEYMSNSLDIILKNIVFKFDKNWDKDNI